MGRRGRLFTYADGRPLKPEYLSHRFRQLVKELDLPPIRFHDLRHGAATMEEVDIKVVQEELGHSTSILTRDTYTSVSPRLVRDAAERTSAAIPRATSAAG